MKKLIYMFLLIACSHKGVSQQSFFLDSLFQYDLSMIVQRTTAHQESERAALNNDWGLSIGTGITNSYQEEIDAGLSTRLYAKINLLSGGYYENLRQRDIIYNQIQIDSIQGNQRSVTHNYGIFFDYIIYLYNIDKLILIDSILEENREVLHHFQQLYYNKLIDYSEIIKINDISLQYTTLKTSLENYNLIFSEVVVDTILPTTETNEVWDVDFLGICKMIDTDSSYLQVLGFQNEVLDLQYDMDNAPTVTLSAGYDISRSRPFFSAGASTRIRTKRRNHLQAKKEINRNELRLEKIQKKKEVLNLQYEYRYKEKQLNGLATKIEQLSETIRKFRVRRDVLSLDESIQEKKLKTMQLQIQYEILDLKGQMMLILLSIKKVLPKANIGKFITPRKTQSDLPKFAGSRFLLQKEPQQLSSFDLLFLEQNEIKIITSKELIHMNDILILDPTQYNTRADLEKEILNQLKKNSSRNFVFEDLAAFKQLELRTLSQKDFAISSIDK